MESLTGESGLREFALGYLYYGLHRAGNNYILREYAPNATEIFVTGSFSNWQTDNQYRMQRVGEPVTGK
jgi:1,4-alpha-glucan branching enzyme